MLKYYVPKSYFAMSNDDWYRKTTWLKSDQEESFARQTRKFIQD